MASLPPRGPTFVSIPMDDWGAEVDPDATPHHVGRTVDGRSAPDPERVQELAAKLNAASSPAMVVGPDVDASGAWDAAIELAEQQGLPVWGVPAPGGGRIGFPEGHPAYQGLLPPAIGPVGEALAPYDLVLVVGSSVFPYYPNIPGPLLPEGAELVAITSDPDEASRAPMGDAIVADPRLALEALIARGGSLRPGEAPGAPSARGRRSTPTPSAPPACTRHSRTSSQRAASSSWNPPRARWRCETRCACRRPGATTSGPAGALGSGSRPRSASSSPSPSARWSACSARARRSTRSRASGRPPPTTCP